MFKKGKYIITIVTMIIMSLMLSGCLITEKSQQKTLSKALDSFINMFDDESLRLQVVNINGNVSLKTYSEIDGFKLRYTSSNLYTVDDTYFGYCCFDNEKYWIYLSQSDKTFMRLGKVITQNEAVKLNKSFVGIFYLVELLKSNPEWMVYDKKSKMYELVDGDSKEIYKSIHDRNAPDNDDVLKKYQINLKIDNGKILKLQYFDPYLKEKVTYSFGYNNKITVELPEFTEEIVLEI